VLVLVFPLDCSLELGTGSFDTLPFRAKSEPSETETLNKPSSQHLIILFII
jgi:hypothetical protein